MRIPSQYSILIFFGPFFVVSHSLPFSTSFLHFIPFSPFLYLIYISFFFLRFFFLFAFPQFIDLLILYFVCHQMPQTLNLTVLALLLCTLLPFISTQSITQKKCLTACGTCLHKCTFNEDVQIKLMMGTNTIDELCTDPAFSCRKSCKMLSSYDPSRCWFEGKK